VIRHRRLPHKRSGGANITGQVRMGCHSPRYTTCLKELPVARA
jgi:hypothetical protein